MNRSTMRRTIATLTAGAALWAAVLAAAPSASLAATGQPAAQNATRTYDTTMTQTQPIPSAGVVAGKLTLTTSSDGVINGWYIPQDAGSPVVVTGAQQGNTLWLELGEMGALRIDGSVGKDGGIVGTATQFPDIGSSYYGIPPAFSFVAKPE